MNPIPRNLFISLVPLLTPVTAFAETDPQAQPVSAVVDTQATGSPWRASEVIGQNVKNAGDETIGEVEDLLVNMKSGEIVGVVISTGGFLGIADTLSTVPVSALRFDTRVKAFKTRLTKEQLGKAPNFKSTAWPDFGDAATMESLRSFRNSIGGDVTAPDNSAQNEKPVNKDDMTPIDQGSGDKDVRITKDIRSAIIDADLSFNTKNVKIITKDGHVYLKGVVENQAEHEAVLKIVKSHASADLITDNLRTNSK